VWVDASSMRSRVINVQIADPGRVRRYKLEDRGVEKADCDSSWVTATGYVSSLTREFRGVVKGPPRGSKECLYPAK